MSNHSDNYIIANNYSFRIESESSIRIYYISTGQTDSKIIHFIICSCSRSLQFKLANLVPYSELLICYNRLPALSYLSPLGSHILSTTAPAASAPPILPTFNLCRYGSNAPNNPSNRITCNSQVTR